MTFTNSPSKIDDVETSDFVSIVEAAKVLGLTKQRVHQLVNSGELQAKRVAGHWLVILSDVERLKAARENVVREGK